MHPKARAAIREFPAGIRDRLGKALFLLQMGERLGMPVCPSDAQCCTGRC